MKSWFQRRMADLFARMETAAIAERQKERREQIRRMAEIHDSCIISEASRICNCHGTPDHISVGPDTAILGDLVLFPKTGNIRIGRKCFLGAQSRVWSASSVTIGDYVLVSHNVNIHDTSGHPQEWSERRREMDQFLPDFRVIPQAVDLDAKPIVIEDDVWIGVNAVILPGVRVGRGSIIGASTVVTKEVPPFTVVAGNPLKIIREVGGEGVG